MNNLTRIAVRALIAEREDLVFQNLKHNPEYQAVVRQQKARVQAIAVLLQKLEQNGGVSIHEHCEGEIQKTGYEITGAYLQGLHDCFHLIGFLNGNEVRL
ncbi:MAG: hypothetical protein LBS36_12610 [Oscillospiraceae bacterium]|jgi:hypothetical protein|nr:hypothetical protein [Oscillospiraceae bacterium]